jgi:hypothetical protein
MLQIYYVTGQMRKKANCLNLTQGNSEPATYLLASPKEDKLLVSTARHVFWPTAELTCPYDSKPQIKPTQILDDAQNGPSQTTRIP